MHGRQQLLPRSEVIHNTAAGQAGFLADRFKRNGVYTISVNDAGCRFKYF